MNQLLTENINNTLNDTREVLAQNTATTIDQQTDASTNDVSDEIKKNQIQFNKNTEFNNYIIKNNNPVLNGGDWYAVLENGKTVYRQGSPNGYYFTDNPSIPNHLTNDPNLAYSGPVNVVEGNLIINNGAIVSGLNFFPTNGNTNGSYTVTVNQGGTLQYSNIFNQNVNTTGNTNHNTYISTTINASGSAVSDSDTFVNPGATSGSWRLSGTVVTTTNNPKSYYLNDNGKTFSSSDGGDVTNTFDNQSRIFHPQLPDTTSKNPCTSKVNFNMNGNSQFGGSDYKTTEQIKNIIDNDAKNAGINTNFTIIGNNNGGIYVSSGTDINGQQVSVYTDENGRELYRGNEPVNFINVHKVIVQNGARLKNANIYGTNNPRVLIQNGGIMENSKVFDGYIGIAQGGISQNNTYYSPEFWYSEGDNFGNHRIDGQSINDTIYEPQNTPSNAPLTTMQEYVRNGKQRCVYDTNSSSALVYNDSSTVPNEFVVANGTSQIHIGSTGQLINPNVYSGKNLPFDFFTGGSMSSSDDGACYLSGTQIEVADGVKNIENIEVGDLIYVYNGMNKILKPVTWIGSAHHYVRTQLPDDIAGYPICITKDALADNVPSKDMYITPEHCLCINGQFIPARMLVNNHSIYYDYSQTDYRYFHIELEEHSIIKADNQLSESYLNTNNHHDFYRSEKVVDLQPKSKSWEKDAAAPLVTAREVIEPLYNTYKERAIKMGIECKIEPQKLTSSPDLHLITDKGETLYPYGLHTNKDSYAFMLPENVKYVFIVSNNDRPNDVIGPYIDDRRSLGVLIQNITLFDDHRAYPITTHLDEKNLKGWNNQEPIPCRWTNGYALLPLNIHSHTKGQRILTLKVIASGPYIVQKNQTYLEQKVS